MATLVTAITFDPSQASIAVPVNIVDGNVVTVPTVSLTPTVSPSTATVQTLSWNSSNTTIATVSASGVVTPVKAGSCTITATATDGSSISASVPFVVLRTPSQYGFNTWNPGWQGPNDYINSSVNLATAVVGVTNIWNPLFLAEAMAFNGPVRFMDSGGGFAPWINWNERIRWDGSMTTAAPAASGGPYGYAFAVDSSLSTINSWDLSPSSANLGNSTAVWDALSGKTATCWVSSPFPYEWQIDFCNRTNRDMWVCVPAPASADFVTQLATLIKNNLNSNLKVWVEVGNENWNTNGTPQYLYCASKAAAKFPSGTYSKAINIWYQAAMYSLWIHLNAWQGFQNVFGAGNMGLNKRVVRMYPGQGGGSDLADAAMLTVVWNGSKAGGINTTLNPGGHIPDIVTFAPYIGPGIISSNYANDLDGNQTNIAAAYYKEVNDVNDAWDYAVLSNSNWGGIPTGGYEGGQQLTTNATIWQTDQAFYYDQYIYQKYWDKDPVKQMVGWCTYTIYGDTWGLKRYGDSPLSMQTTPRMVQWLEYITGCYTNIKVKTITLDPATIYATAGGAIRVLHPTILPTNARERTLTFASTNTAVATVDGSGTITFVANGTCNITATATDGSGVVGSCAVTVSAAVATSSVSLNITSQTVGVNSIPPILIPTASPANATNTTATWATSNNSVVEVSKTGGLNFSGAGSATITVTVGGKTATCVFTVTAQVFPTAIALGTSALTLAAGSAVQALTATYTPSNTSNKSVYWKSSAPWIAAVDMTGNVTPLLPGTATISAISTGAHVASVAVTVTPNVAVPTTGITVSPTTMALTSGGATSTITPTIAPANASSLSVTYVSSNTAVATVDSAGVVTPLSAGSTTITATNSGGQSATVAVTVTNVSTTGVTISPTTASLTGVGATQQLTPTVAPSNASIKTVTYSSSNTAVATVDSSGLVTSTGVGTATITVTTTSGSFTATCAVTVFAVTATGITLNVSSGTVGVGQTQQLTPTVAPANATNTTVTYSSSNTAVATVNSSGLVTAVAIGSATITATNSAGQTATFVITVVTAILLTSVVLSSSSISLAVGGATATLTTTVAPSNAQNKNVNWSSSNTAIATVNSSGVVSPVSAGSATITATAADGSGVYGTCAVTVQVLTGYTLASDTVGGVPANIVPVGTSVPLIVETASGYGNGFSGVAGNVVVPNTSANQQGGVYNLSLFNPSSPDQQVIAEILVYQEFTNVGFLLRPQAGTFSGTGSTDYILAFNYTSPYGIQSGYMKQGYLMIVEPNSITAATVAIYKIGATTATLVGTSASVTLYKQYRFAVNGTTLTIDGSADGGTTFTNLLTTTDSTYTTSTGNIQMVNDGVWYSPGVAVGPMSMSTPSVAVTSLTETVGKLQFSLNAAAVPLYPTTLPANATNSALSYVSSNTAVAIVSSSGLVTPVAVGTTTITIGTTDGSNLTKTVAVSVSASAATASSLQSTLGATSAVVTNNSITMSVTSNLGSTITYSSSATGVATVSAAGVITGVTAGTATITATDGTSGLTITTVVTVSVVAVTGISLPATLAANLGFTSQLTPTFTPGAVSNTGVTWSSATPATCTIDANGVITPVANGTSVITVTANDVTNGTKTATCTVTVTTTAVTGVTDAITTLTIFTTGKYQLPTPVIAPANASIRTGTWSSTNTARATVNASTGLIQGVAAGTCTIRFTTTSGAKTCNVALTVSASAVAVTGVSVSPTSVTLSPAQTQQLTPTITPSGATNKVYYYSSATPSVATVSSTGLITAVAAGTATITVTSADGNFVANCSVTVSGTPNVVTTGITVSPTTASLLTGATQQLTPSILPANATNTAVTYASSNTGIATVNSSGLITAVAVGSATITATNSGGQTATCVLTITAPIVAATGVTLAPTTAALSVGGTQQLTPTVAPANATTKTVTYGSNNSGVATVNSSGLITAVAAGTATITVTTTDGSFTATCVVTVTAVASVYSTNFIGKPDYSAAMIYKNTPPAGVQWASGKGVLFGGWSKIGPTNDPMTGAWHLGDIYPFEIWGTNFYIQTVGSDIYTSSASVGYINSNISLYSAAFNAGTPSRLTYNATAYAGDFASYMTLNIDTAAFKDYIYSAWQFMFNTDNSLTTTQWIYFPSTNSMYCVKQTVTLAQWRAGLVANGVASGVAAVFTPGSITNFNFGGPSGAGGATGGGSDATNVFARSTIREMNTQPSAQYIISLAARTTPDPTAWGDYPLNWTGSTINLLDQSGHGNHMDGIAGTFSQGPLMPTFSITNVAVTNIAVSSPTLSLATGATSILSYSVTPMPSPLDYGITATGNQMAADTMASGQMASNQLATWSSSNTAVATVDSAGFVTAISAGTANIIVTSLDTTNGTLTATCALTVTAGGPTTPVTGISLSSSSGNLNAGSTLQLAPIFAPSGATNQNATYSSNAAATATVNASGLVTGVAAGTAIITVTASDTTNGTFTATYTVTVVVAPTSLALNNTTLTVPSGSSPVTLVATFTPSNTTNKNLTWSSSNTAIATVDSAGVVTFLTVGNTTITATSVANTNISASCAITVQGAASAPTSTITGLSYNTTIALAVTTPGTTIYYTTDGTTPTTSSSVYSSAIAISKTTTVNAIATGGGFTSSIVATFVVTITVATPTISTNGGTFSSTQSLTLSCADSGAAIKYTTDGTAPDSSGTAIVYSGAFAVNTNCTVKFFAYRTGCTNSPVVSSNAFIFQVTNPTISVNGGSFTDGPQTITLACTTVGASIKYTTDGTDPTSSGTAIIYANNISITGNTTLKYYAYLTGYTNSSTITSNAFAFTVAVPTISTNGGAFTNGPVAVTLACATSGSSIYYTTDGTAPDSSGTATLYTTALSVSGNVTLRFVAKKTNYTNSTIVVSNPFAFTVANPVITWNNSNPLAPTVTIATTTTGAAIYYTIDGSTPSAASTLYTTTILPAVDETIKAIAIKTNYTSSTVVSQAVTIQVQPVTFSLLTGSQYSAPASLTLACATAGAVIKYTTDGSTPTAASTTYSGAIALSGTQTVKAYATATSMEAASVTSASYTFTVAVPTIDINGGSFTDGSQLVHLTSATPGAAIRYTTDGSTPTAASTLYSGAIAVSSSLTLKFFASLTNYTSSSVVTSTPFVFSVLTPTIDVNGGNFTNAATIHLSDTTSSATIKYTVDGTDPSSSGTATVYNGTSLVLNTSCTLRYVATKTGYTSSSVVTSSQFVFTAAVPSISINGGTFATPQSVTLSDNTSGATILYTVDGTNPATSPTAITYSGAFSVATTCNVNAIATKTGYTASNMFTSVQFFFGVDQPTIDVNGGNFTGGTQVVHLSCTTSGAVIAYTLDGTNPQSSGTVLVYSGSISISVNTVIIFYAYKNGSTSSALVTSNPFVFTAATPTLDTNGGNFSSGSVTVHLTTSTPGAVIKYTVDGSSPISNGSALTYVSANGIVISSNTTLKYYASLTGYTDSTLGVSSPFIFTVAIPTSDVNGGAYAGSVTVHLTCTTAGSVIKYTTDGSDPSSSGTALIYGSSISMNTNGSLKFVGTKTGYTNSAIGSTAAFSFNCATPSISVNGGSFTSQQLILLSSTTVGASIKYTTDGTDPTVSTSAVLYSSNVPVDKNMVIKAYAFASGYTNSAVFVSNPFNFSVTDPIASIHTGTFSAPITVTITPQISETSSIVYTTDGSDPRISVTAHIYSNPIVINSSCTLAFVGEKSGFTNSNLITEQYTFVCAAPVLGLAPGIYYSAQTLTISCTDTSAIIYYSTDGSIPSLQYTGVVTINGTCNVNTITKKTGWSNSGLVTGSYVFTCYPPVVVQDPSVAMIDIGVVSITEQTSTATVKYTLDGSDPTSSGTVKVYTGPILLKHTTTLKVYATQSGYTGSAVGTYNFTVQPPIPSFSTSSTTASSAVIVSLVTPLNPDMITRYTTDGSDPTSSSLIYTAPITIGTDATITARTFDSVNGSVSASQQAVFQQITSGATTIIQTSITSSIPPGITPPASLVMVPIVPQDPASPVVGVFRAYSSADQAILETIAEQLGAGATILARINTNNTLVGTVFNNFIPH